MRKEKIITIKDRDQNLTFKIRELSATKLESFVIRSMLLLASSGIEVPQGQDLNAAGEFLAGKGLAALGNINFEKASPLLDELLSCCSRVVEGVEELCTPQTVDGYIMDVQTLFKLRMEAIKLNLGFFRLEQEKSSSSPEKANTAVQ